MRLFSAALVAGMTLAGASVLTEPAHAAVRGFATADVNQRAGPGTEYPVITVVPYGAPVIIFGCLGPRSWCDVAWGNARGWVHGNYLQARYSGRRVGVPSYYGPLAIPTITFSFGSYWDNHYRHRHFYRDRDRWRHHWERRDRRDDRREMRRDRRDDWRDEVRRDRPDSYDKWREFDGDRDRDRVREPDRRRDGDRDRARGDKGERSHEKQREEWWKKLCPGPRCPN